MALSSPLGSYIRRGVSRARSPEVYQYLQSFLSQGPSQLKKNMHLADMAAAGDSVMVRHLLAIGADPLPKDKDLRASPLMRAVRGWHEDVVDVLLEHGADPNEHCGFRRGTALTCAAMAGSMSLLRKPA